MPARRSATRSGFTLFEVMAAVLVLGVLYSVLATSAIQGLRTEGESKRRLEASLLADEQLIDIESALGSGDFPDIGVQESEADGGYRITVEVTPFDITPFLGEDFLADLSEGDADSLLAPSDRPEDSLLRLLSVVVRWNEAEGEHEVRRTTLAYDQATIVGMLPEPGADGEQTPSGGDDNPDIEGMLDMLEGAQ